MAEALGASVLELRTDLKPLTRGMKRGHTEAKKGAKKIDKVGSDLSKSWAKNMQNAGKAMTLLVTVPLAGLSAAVVKLASDAEETGSKFRTVFRDIEQVATGTARTLADEFGFSNLEIERMLGDVGDLLTGFGFSQDSALGLADEVTRLGADLASFTNFAGGAEGAVSALTKAMLGEREMAKSLGLVITEAGVQAKILEGQQRGVTFATNEQAKAWAALQIATEQSGNAIGDVARTSDSFANQMRFLKSDITDLGVEIGQILLPVAKDLLEWVRDAIKWFSDLTPEVKKSVVVFAGMSAAIGPILIVLPKLIAGIKVLTAVSATAWAAGAGPVALLVGGLVAMAAAVAFLGPKLNDLAGQGGTLASSLDEIAAELAKANPGFEAVVNDVEATGAGFDKINELLAQFGQKMDAGTTATTELAAAVVELTEDDKTWLKLIEGVNAELDLQERLFATLGDEYDIIGAQTATLTDAITELIEKGWAPQSDNIRTLLGLIPQVVPGLNELTTKALESAAAMASIGSPSFGLEGAAGLLPLPPPPIEPLTGPGESLGEMAFDALNEASEGMQALTGFIDGAVAVGGDLVSMFMEFLPTLGSVQAVLNPLATIFKGMMEVLGPLIDRALKPLVDILMLLGNVLGQILAPVFTVLGDVVAALAAGFAWFFNKVIRPVGNLIIGIFSLVGAVIAHLVNGILALIQIVTLGIVNIPRVPIPRVGVGNIAEISVESAPRGRTGGADTGDVGAGGPGATFRQARPISVVVDVHDNEVYGGSLRELAFLLRDEFVAIDVLRA